MLKATRPCHTRVHGARWLPRSRIGYNFLWDTKNSIANGMSAEPQWFEAMCIHPPPPTNLRTWKAKDIPKITYPEDQLRLEYLTLRGPKAQLWVYRALYGDLIWEKHPTDLFVRRQQDLIDVRVIL
jgi:hypothetical protein